MISVVICASLPTLIEPLQRQGLISLPSSWSGPSKHILHCGGPLEGKLVVVGSFVLSTSCMLAASRRCATCVSISYSSWFRSVTWVPLLTSPCGEPRWIWGEGSPKTSGFTKRKQINPLSFWTSEHLWDMESWKLSFQTRACQSLASPGPSDSLALGDPPRFADCKYPSVP